MAKWSYCTALCDSVSVCKREPVIMCECVVGKRISSLHSSRIHVSVLACQNGMQEQTADRTNVGQTYMADSPTSRPQTVLDVCTQVRVCVGGYRGDNPQVKLNSICHILCMCVEVMCHRHLSRQYLP